jgi:hypothetical protein
VRRALVRFNATSTAVIPAGSTILGATLRVRHLPPAVVGAANGTQVIDVHRVTASWGEGSTVALSQGQGAAAAAGDATWIRRFFNTTSWVTPGGDFAVPATSSISVDEPSGSYDSGSLAADVTAWRAGTADNFGWILRGPEGGVARTVKWLGTRDDGSSINRPRLIITFRRPLP